MKKILFLDLDGVINSMDNMYAMYELWKINNQLKSKDEFGDIFDERCVRWLHWIVLKTGCDIVISSSWRLQGWERIQLMWQERKLPGRIVGITTSEIDPAIVELYASNVNEDCRGYEIQQWIDAHKPERYCIVDDHSDMLPHQEFVQTNSRIGLNYETAHKIVSILNSKKPKGLWH